MPRRPRPCNAISPGASPDPRAAGARVYCGSMTSISRFSTLLVILVAVTAFIAGVYLALPTPPNTATPDIEGLLWPNPPRVEAFSLTDAKGARFDEMKLEGHWTLVFFGFTHCPDVCPGTLTTLKAVVSRLAGNSEFASRGQVLFVSVDPERDTPQVLQRYVEHFDRSFLAATAPAAELAAFTAQLGILHARVNLEAGDYTIDHTASLILIGPARERIAVFSAPHVPEEIAGRVARVIELVEGEQ